MTAASVANADEICISTLDRTRGQCDNRTNVRRLRGSNMSRVEEFEQWLAAATEQEKREMLAAIKSMLCAASCQGRTDGHQD